MKGKPKHLSLRIDEDLLRKFEYVAKYDDRSINTTSIYKKQSGDNDLHFSNCLPDRNFQFSIFNFQFKKTSARA